MQLAIKPCITDFQTPVYSSTGAAAFDIYSPTNVLLKRNETILVPLGFEAAVPLNHVALLVTRSGQGCNHGVTLRNQVGVIDSDYRGEWKIQLTLDNFEDKFLPSTTEYQIKRGNKIVQCLIVPVQQVTFNLVTSLDSTERGDGGFGSTGL